ncbi:hypothetical protein [uncultured Desulfosarcina sp.]|uniref:hypothetical protein n=1 Tax=uncultured Desulfosarcina sp. TaxID=218289 RepID=UPI0029C71B15|nr:hypothetical protein [uncultured Desulfosarcina sp.]
MGLIVKRFSKFMTLNVAALTINFVGAVLIAFSAGELTVSRGLIVFYSGPRALHLNHPNLFRMGIVLIIIGFLIQLISEIVKQSKR